MKTLTNAILWMGILLPATMLHALGLRVPDQDARAVARGNAFVATADNPSAVYYNPAGITQLQGQNASVGAYGISLGSSFTAPNGAKADTKDKFQALPQFFYTYSPTNLPLSAGLGFYAPYGLGMEWPDTVPFRNVALRGEMTYLTLNPVVAWKVLPTLSIAAGPTFSYSDVDLRQGVFTQGDQARFTGEDYDAGFNVGILWKPLEKHAFGLTYRSATTMNYKGDFSLKLNPPFPSSSQFASARFDFPQQITAGYSFRPTEAWNLEFNIDWTDWDYLDTVFLRKTPVTPMPFNWQSSFMYEFGATRYLCHGFALSGGYMFSQSSVPTSSFSPAVPDSDRHLFSVGLGQQYKRLRWDAAYQFAFGPSRTVDGSINGPSVNGSYEFISHALALSFGFSF